MTNGPASTSEEALAGFVAAFCKRRRRAGSLEKRAEGGTITRSDPSFALHAPIILFRSTNGIVRQRCGARKRFVGRERLRAKLDPVAGRGRGRELRTCRLIAARRSFALEPVGGGEIAISRRATRRGSRLLSHCGSTKDQCSDRNECFHDFLLFRKCAFQRSHHTLQKIRSFLYFRIIIACTMCVTVTEILYLRIIENDQLYKENRFVEGLSIRLRIGMLPVNTSLLRFLAEKVCTMATMNSRRLVLASAIASVIALPGFSADAAAQAGSKKTRPTEVISCREFVALRDEFKPQVVSYALGYTHAKRPDIDMIDVSGVDRLVPVLVKSCRSRPSETLVQRIRAFFHRL